MQDEHVVWDESIHKYVYADDYGNHGDLPRNWRKWSSERIQGWIVALEAADDDSVIQLISDMEDELDKREQEEDLSPQGDAREGERPYWA
jgi:hypothetical protein